MFTSTFQSLLSLNTHAFVQWLYVDFSDFILALLVAFSTWNLFTAVSFRYKIYYFLLNICLFSIWGFCGSFDGLVLMMLVTEFSVAIFFIFLFITAKFKKEQTIISSKLLWAHIFAVIFLYLYSINLSFATYFYFFNNVYPYMHDIVAHDLAILYYFVLYYNPILTIHLSVILGLFSLFFICLFFTIKFVKQIISPKPKEIFTLRKQLLYYQTNFGVRIRTFQTKICSKKVVLVFPVIQVGYF